MCRACKQKEAFRQIEQQNSMERVKLLVSRFWTLERTMRSFHEPFVRLCVSSPKLHNKFR
jgi:hypothetical protein